MAKKPKDNGWVFVQGTDSVEGKKVYEPGHVAEVTGRDLDEAKDLAALRDQQVDQRQQGRCEQADAEFNRIIANERARLALPPE